MKKAILGKKIGMTQIFDENAKMVPVTVIQAGPCVVVQKKIVETDGYDSIQVGFGDVKEKALTKPEKGHFAKADVPYKKHLKEFRLDDISAMNVGDEIKADIFASGEKIDISGITKGKGFQGVIKRWNQSRGPMSHGSGYHRRPGSMGACSDPSRVMKGKHLPGHMGVEKVTIQNLEVVKIDVEKNLILVKGAVPGNKGGLVILKDSTKA